MNKKIPKFKLYTLQNKLIKNYNWEYDEQQILFKYIKQNDHVLQLGGNIGTSCIIVDRILNKKKNNNICVEPNPLLFSILSKNKRYTKSKFTIIKKAITKKKNLKLYYNKFNSDLNYWGARISSKYNKNRCNKNINKRKYKKVKITINSIDLKKIKNYKKINVVFADCEGCIEKFLNEFYFILKQLRLIIYERDSEDICNYNNVYKLLKNNGFKLIKRKNLNYIWENKLLN